MIFDFLEIKSKSNIDGVNLKPLIEGMNFPENPAYIESNPLIDMESNDVIGVRTSNFKYFRDKDPRDKNLNFIDAELYMNWIISEEAKELINNYKVNGEQLFFFNHH